MRHVDTTGVAPLRYDVPVAHDHPGRSTSHLERADAETERLAAEALVLTLFLVARLRGLVCDGVVDGCLYSGGVHPDFCGLPGLPGAPCRDVLGRERGG